MPDDDISTGLYGPFIGGVHDVMGRGCDEPDLGRGIHLPHRSAQVRCAQARERDSRQIKYDDHGTRIGALAELAFEISRIVKRVQG